MCGSLGYRLGGGKGTGKDNRRFQVRNHVTFPLQNVVTRGVCKLTVLTVLQGRAEVGTGAGATVLALQAEQAEPWTQGRGSTNLGLI